MSDADRVVPIFRLETRESPRKTLEEKRPIFFERELCEIRFAGDRQKVSVFPAHTISSHEAFGTSGDPITYAQRFPAQYKRFKEKRAQAVEGTPLEELTFLSAAKRSELKALNIYTAEALASLDGDALKTLGMGGRDMKNEADAYLKRARSSADVAELQAQNAELKARLDAMEAEKSAPRGQFDGADERGMKAYIKDKTGKTPVGNPSLETLKRMASELDQ